MAKKKKNPKTVLVCGCAKVDQTKDRFVTSSKGDLCECTVRDRETGEFIKEKGRFGKSKGLKEEVFGSISIQESSDTLERVE